MVAGHFERNPISAGEDQTIRHLAKLGYSPLQMRQELEERGFPIRGKDSIRAYLVSQCIRIDPIASHTRKIALCRAGGYRSIGRPEANLTPQDSNDEFAKRWAEHHTDQKYSDEPRAAWKSRTTTPRPVRNYGCNHMTTGGVAVYG